MNRQTNSASNTTGNTSNPASNASYSTQTTGRTTTKTTTRTTTRTTARWIVAVIALLHGLIHLLGTAKGFGFAHVSQLKHPIGATAGAVWLAATLLMGMTAMMLIGSKKQWWIVGALAVATSQVAIFTSWTDAKAGTFANLVLLFAVVYGFASSGPTSFRAKVQRRADIVFEETPPATRVIAESDLDRLPQPVADYLRQANALGYPRITRFRAAIHGRIRSGAEKPWMTFVGQQINTFGANPSRVFYIDATMSGLPVDVLHTFANGRAAMRVKICSLFTMASAWGPELDRAETVTVFNDMCILAPAALVDAPIVWQELSATRVRGTFTNGSQVVSAELVFNEAHELVNFVSDDRFRSVDSENRFLNQIWSTPLRRYRTIGRRRVATYGEARWHAPNPEGTFTYLEFNLDDIEYELHTPAVLEKRANPVLIAS